MFQFLVTNIDVHSLSAKRGALKDQLEGTKKGRKEIKKGGRKIEREGAASEPRTSSPSQACVPPNITEANIERNTRIYIYLNKL